MMQKGKKLLLTISALLLVLLCCTSALAATITVTSDPIEDGAISTTVYMTIDNSSGTAAMENITISNAYNIVFDTAGVTIAPGKVHQMSTQAVVNAEMIGQTVEFQLSWTETDAAAGTSEQKSGTAKVKLSRPSSAGIAATRTASNKQASPGEIITLTYTVTNSGAVTLKKISITDKEIAGSTPIAKDITLAPGETQSFTYEYKMGYATVTSQPVVSYTIDGESSAKTFNGISALVLGMVNSKLSVDVQQGANTENGVTFTLTLMNDGNQKLKSIRVKDELGKALNEESFSLAIGESRTLTHTVKADDVRYVVFYISGYTADDEAYEDKTQSYIVRKYIDPSLLGIEFFAQVTETLNAEGSISVRFTINNTGSMDMTNLVLSEAQQGELKRVDTAAPGEHQIDQTVFVGEPHDLVFTLEMTDPAGNPYTYTTNISANYVGVSVAPADGTENASVTTLGGNLGASVTNTLRALFIVLIILTTIFGIAFVALAVLERKRREELKHKRAVKERQERAEQHRAQTRASTESLGTAHAPAQGAASKTLGATRTQERARTSADNSQDTLIHKGYGAAARSGEPRKRTNQSSGETLGATRQSSRRPSRPSDAPKRPDPKL